MIPEALARSSLDCATQVFMLCYIWDPVLNSTELLSA